MEVVISVLEWIGVVSLTVSTIVVVVVVGYFWLLADWLEYRKAKKEIFEYAKQYKDRCTGGANRFVVTVEILQSVFIEYDISTIHKVWLELVNERIVEQDPLDKTWCIR